MSIQQHTHAGMQGIMIIQLLVLNCDVETGPKAAATQAYLLSISISMCSRFFSSCFLLSWDLCCTQPTVACPLQRNAVVKHKARDVLGEEPISRQTTAAGGQAALFKPSEVIIILR